MECVFKNSDALFGGGLVGRAGRGEDPRRGLRTSRAGKIWTRALGKATRAGQELGKELDLGVWHATLAEARGGGNR